MFLCHKVHAFMSSSFCLEVRAPLPAVFQLVHLKVAASVQHVEPEHASHVYHGTGCAGLTRNKFVQ